MKPVLSAGQKVLVVGFFQSGKTTRAREIVERAPAAIAWDPTGEFAKAGWLACRVSQVSRAVARARFVAVHGDPEHDFQPFCAAVRRLRGWVVVIDELSMSISGTSPASVKGAFSELWRLGHKGGISVVLTTHRVSEVPVLLRSVHHHLQFRAAHRTDLGIIAEEWGDATAETVRNLPAYHYLHVGPDQRPTVMPPDKPRKGRLSPAELAHKKVGKGSKTVAQHDGP